jgi:hypothetical protein
MSYERTSVALRPLKPLGSCVALGTLRAHLANLSGCDIDLDMLVFFLALGDLSEEYRLLFLPTPGDRQQPASSRTRGRAAEEQGGRGAQHQDPLDFQSHIRRGLRVQRVEKRLLANLRKDLGAASAAQLQPAAGKRGDRGEREHGHQCADARGAQARVPHHARPPRPVCDKKCEVSLFRTCSPGPHELGLFPSPS